MNVFKYYLTKNLNITLLKCGFLVTGHWCGR